MEEIWQCRFPKRSRPFYVISTKTNDSMMVQDIGIQSKSVLVRKFAHERARNFSDEAWSQKIFEGTTMKIIEYCKNEDEILCYLRAWLRQRSSARRRASRLSSAAELLDHRDPCSALRLHRVSASSWNNASPRSRSLTLYCACGNITVFWTFLSRCFWALWVFLHQLIQSTFLRGFWLVFLQVTNDLHSSFYLSVNHLGVFLHGEAQVLVLHGYHVGVDRWDGRDHFAKLQLILFALGTALSRLLLALLFCLLVTWIIRCTITAKFTESADASSVLLRTVHHALRDVLVYRTLLYVLCVVCGVDQHHCSLPPRAAREGVRPQSATALVRVHVGSCSGKRLEHDFDRAPRVLLRPPGVRPAKALRVLQPPLRLSMCVMPSGHFSAQTRSFWSTRKHVCWSLALVIGASRACLTVRSAHGFLREPHRGVFAQSCTVLPLTLRDLGLLPDDLFLRSWDLRVLVIVGLCLSSHLPAG